MPPVLLRAAVIAAFVYALTALAILTARTLSFGRRPVFSRSAGSARAGVTYAFLKGMLPWEKESVAGHVPTFVAGLLYHAGIFLAFLQLLLVVTGLRPGAVLLKPLRVVITLGLVAGLGLLLKRAALRKMRMISVPDDVVANVMVDLFLAAAVATTMSHAFASVFLIMAIALFLYMPMGKIRHCVFFFYTRIVFGMFFGRRGVLPHPRTDS